MGTQTKILHALSRTFAISLVRRMRRHGLKNQVVEGIDFTRGELESFLGGEDDLFDLTTNCGELPKEKSK